MSLVTCIAWDVTVNADGSLNGTSEEGGVLIGQQDGAFVNIEITSPQGDVYNNRPSDLTRALDYPVKGNAPDTYVAIVTPRGRFIFGRSGLVRSGTDWTSCVSSALVTGGGPPVLREH